MSGGPPGGRPPARRVRLPAPASANELALLRFPDRRSAWVVVAAATLAEPAARLGERLAALHQAVPMTGARLRGEVWHPGSPPDPLIADGDPLHAPALLDRFDLATQPPLRIVVGSEGHRLAVACHHAAFDGRSLVALLAALVGGAGGQPGVADDPGHPAPGPAPRAELRGLVGRMVRPADRVAASPGRHVRDAMAVREVRLGGAGVTARLAEAAAAAAGARNARMGRPWRRVGINVGVAGHPVIGNSSRYRRLDLRAGESVGPGLAAALASSREPLDQVWSPRLGWLLEPVAGRFSDSLLVSNLGRCVVPGATRLEFFPVARGRSAVAVAAAGLAGGPSTVSVRARDLSSEDAEALLDDLVARLTGGA